MYLVKTSGFETPQSSGSRANYAHFYGLDPKQVTREQYEGAKKSIKLPVRSGAFQLSNVDRHDPNFQKAARRFYNEPSSAGSAREPDFTQT